LGLGGSQGSVFLNESLIATAPLLKSKAEVLLATGRGNFEVCSDQVHKSGARVTLAPYLETNELVNAYERAAVAVARSGGTVAEFAVFGLPSVLIPLPSSADDHQLRNAEEFVAMGGALLVQQDRCTPGALAEAIDHWLGSPDARASARVSLQQWDVPDATERIVARVEAASKGGRTGKPETS
jgi:UDP-N-acetylglucosamine--N-acetylmuramyl-(pentapeptide) pyrophosphoryl-undecaprenol N-acetylglucosamine transferase